jgi:hypothetical protein
VLFARTGDVTNPEARSLYVWTRGRWVEIALPSKESEIEATGGGYVVVSSGDSLEAYRLAPLAEPRQ